MITCNRCGKPVQAGLANCPNCGMPLSRASQGRIDPGQGAPAQSELPAWLQSLRVNERPGKPANEQQFFSSSDLIEEGALPSWMRPENAEMMDKGNSGKYPAWRPASMFAPSTDAGIPPGGFSAGSLIDERSLPSWVQGNQQNSQASSAAPAAQGSYSATNQRNNQPDWMQSLSQLAQNAAPASPNNVWGGGERSFQGQGINSAAPANVDPNTPSQGISPHDLIDPRALPGWMTGQPGQPAAPQAGFSASSLVDTNSLPAWLHENEQAQSQPGQMRAYPPAQPGQIPAGHGSLEGASLIDMNALPGWMRSYDSQQQAGTRPASYGTTPRVEGARVPSRPRGEMAPHVQSEAAANVFSSMLGVASSAPYFPSAGGQPNAFPENVPASPQGEYPQPAGAQWGASSQPPAFAGYAGGYPGAYPPGGYPASGQPGMTQQPQGYAPGAQPAPPVSGQRSNTPGSKPAKRGFIETILSWFPR